MSQKKSALHFSSPEILAGVPGFAGRVLSGSASLRSPAATAFGPLPPPNAIPALLRLDRRGAAPSPPLPSRRPTSYEGDVRAKAGGGEEAPGVGKRENLSSALSSIEHRQHSAVFKANTTQRQSVSALEIVAAKALSMLAGKEVW